VNDGPGHPAGSTVKRNQRKNRFIASPSSFESLEIHDRSSIPVVLIGEVGLLLEFEECKVLRVHHHHEIDTESIHHHVVSLVGIMTDAEVKVLVGFSMAPAFSRTGRVGGSPFWGITCGSRTREVPNSFNPKIELHGISEYHA